MGIGDNILLVSCLAGVMLALPSLLIFLNIALIGTSNRATSRLDHGGCVPFAVGIAVALFMGIPAAILLSIGSVPQAIGAVMSLLLLFFGFVGLAVVARLVGKRLVTLYEREESPLVQTVAGSLILSFSIAFPLLGWFIILPFSLITGLGAVIIALFAGFGSNFRRSEPETAPKPGPIPAPAAPVAYNYDAYHYDYDQQQ